MSTTIHSHEYELISEGGFDYIETQPNSDKPVVLLLHGLFGALSNFEGIISTFGPQYNVVVPILPIMTMPLREVSIMNLVKHIDEFVEHKGFDKVNALGNSLGGHIALLFVLGSMDKVNSLTLTGSSGLFENAMGDSFPSRNNYEFIKKKTEFTFYDPKVATKELVDEVFNTVNDRDRGLRIVMTAKSAIRHNLTDRLHEITVPTLLVWGKQDNITPYFVGEKFEELMPNAELIGIDKCGHAPMMELPEQFNDALGSFLSRVTAA